MSIEGAITCIDIGSSKIRTVIGYFDEQKEGKLNILGVGISDSKAMRKGSILDMEEFQKNIDSSLEEAEKMAGEQSVGAFISFNSSSFEVIDNKGIIAISGDEVQASDVERVLDMVRNGVNLQNREVLKVIPEHFMVDSEEGVKYPVGMSARKLEAKANIFSIGQNILNNIKKGVEGGIGVEVYDVYPNLISAPEGVLTKRQKELGVVCIDIGASTTGITVFEEGVLKYSSIIPIGGESVTSDVALGLRTSIDTAEQLKLEFGELNLEKKQDYDDVMIDLGKISSTESGEISTLYLSQIITARYEEIMRFIRDELKVIGKDGMLPEGAVLVGAGAKMRGLTSVTKDILRLPVIIGVPSVGYSVPDTSLNDPSFAGVLGTLSLANKYSNARNTISFNIGSLFGSITKVFKKLLP